MFAWPGLIARAGERSSETECTDVAHRKRCGREAHNAQTVEGGSAARTSANVDSLLEAAVGPEEGWRVEFQGAATPMAKIG